LIACNVQTLVEMLLEVVFLHGVTRIPVRVFWRSFVVGKKCGDGSHDVCTFGLVWRVVLDLSPLVHIRVTGAITLRVGAVLVQHELGPDGCDEAGLGCVTGQRRLNIQDPIPDID
jgi:hypothetical protein